MTALETAQYLIAGAERAVASGNRVAALELSFSAAGYLQMARAVATSGITYELTTIADVSEPVVNGRTK